MSSRMIFATSYFVRLHNRLAIMRFGFFDVGGVNESTYVIIDIEGAKAMATTVLKSIKEFEEKHGEVKAWQEHEEREKKEEFLA